MNIRESDKIWADINRFVERSKHLNGGKGLSKKMLAKSVRPKFKVMVNKMSRRQLRTVALTYMMEQFMTFV